VLLGPEELIQDFVCGFLSTDSMPDLTMAEGIPATTLLDSLVVEDGGKVIIFCCPSCQGNQIVELSDFSTGLETLFPGIDVASLGTLLFLTDRGLERKYHNDDSCVNVEDELDEDELDVRCTSVDQFKCEFATFVREVWTLLGPITVLYYERSDQSVEDVECCHDEKLTACRNKQCIPVLYLKDVRSLGVIKRVIGSVSMEDGDCGRIVEVESAGDEES